MKLRDLIPADDIEATVRQIVDALLDPDIRVTIEGEAIATFDHKEYVCPECGQTGFATGAALGGHRYHKHGVTKQS